MSIKRDQITGLGLVILGIVLFLMIGQFSKPMTAEYPGPRLMPSIAAFGFVVCGIGIFAKGCCQKERDRVIITRAGMIRIVITFLVLVLYILGLQYLGFLLSTPFLVYGLSTYFAKASGGKTGIWMRLLFAVAVTGVIWAMYVPLFGMELPIGQLFE